MENCGRMISDNPLDGFVDATALLGAGVFVLVYRGEVVYVGKATGPMLAKIAALRGTDRPKWLPNIRFDQVLIRRVHPDRIAAVRMDLIAEFQPKHNADRLIQGSAPIRIERRL